MIKGAKGENIQIYMFSLRLVIMGLHGYMLFCSLRLIIVNMNGKYMNKEIKKQITIKCTLCEVMLSTRVEPRFRA